MDLRLNKLSSAKRIALGEILGTIPSDAYFGLRKDGLLGIKPRKLLIQERKML